MTLQRERDSHDLNSKGLILILRQKPILRQDILSSHSAQICGLFTLQRKGMDSETEPPIYALQSQSHHMKCFCECDLGVIKRVTKCKCTKVLLLFIQLTKKISHKKSQFLKTGKVYSHLLVGEKRRKNRGVGGIRRRRPWTDHHSQRAG